MKKDDYKWINSVPNLSDEKIELYITDTNVLTNLNERLGVLQVEDMKRGLNYE